MSAFQKLSRLKRTCFHQWDKSDKMLSAVTASTQLSHDDLINDSGGRKRRQAPPGEPHTRYKMMTSYFSVRRRFYFKFPLFIDYFFFKICIKNYINLKERPLT